MFKKILSLVVIATLFINVDSSAQITPDGILFQAIARDANGNGAAGRNIYAKVNLLKGTSTGTSVYAETFKVVSTDEGIFTIVIGKGTRTSGVTNLKAILWNEALYFVNIQIAIEPTVPGIGWTPDNNYVDMGTSQLWTVPYALFSSKATVADSAMSISTIVPGSKGGTGVNNDGKTITLGQNLTFKGIGDITITTTGVSNISFPTTGLLANTQYVSDRIGTDTVSLSNRINAINLSANNATSLKVNISDTANMLNPYLRKLDTASLSKRINVKLDSAQIPGIIAPYLASVSGVKYADTALMLSNRFARDTVSLSNRINNNKQAIIDSAIALNTRKVNYSDTALMLSPYAIGANTVVSINTKVNITDTAAMLLPYAIRLNTETSIDAEKTRALAAEAFRVNYSDTLTMLSPYAIRSNTVASINAEKTRAEGVEILKLNIADTSSMLSPYALRSNTESSNNEKVNLTDTATMLLPYAKLANTEASINEKINITDSAAMLLPYAIRSNTIASINTKVNIADTANMLATYAILSNTEASINAEKSRAQLAENARVKYADTTSMLLPYAVLANTEVSINEKINITDSAAMLLPYAIRSNTVASINSKVNIADTTNMLSPYAILSNTEASINAEKSRAQLAEIARVKYTDTSSMLFPYALKSSTSDLINEKVNIADTASMLSPYAIRSNTEVSINEKINILDSAAMLLPYAIRLNTEASINAEKTRAITAENLRLKYADTTSILSPYAKLANTEASLNEKVNIADTTNMLSPYAIRLNTEASINAEKTRALNAEAARVKYADTLSMLSPYALKSSTSDFINEKVNISDTANMLSAYAVLSNTVASINAERTRAINAEASKVNIADTSSMLTPYAIRSNTIASLDEKVNILDTANMLSKYAIRSNTVASLNLKAPLASPEFTGTPKAPTATTGTNTTQIATTAFVAASITSGATPDATTTSKGKLQLTNDLGGTADLPTVTYVGGSTAENVNAAEMLANAATAANTNNTIVKRNASGDFTAGTITANLLGTSTNVTGIVAGANGGTGVDNTGKTITLGGNVNTGAAFTTTGTTGAGNAADITLKTTGASELTLPLTGTLATLTGVEALTNKTINGITPTTSANGFTLSGGTASKTLTVNNNANVSGTNTGDQTIALTGDITGSGAGTFSTTLASSGVTAGSYGSATVVPTITVDAKGRVTNVANTTISGVSPVGSSMGSGKIIVGDALGIASIVDMSGDVTIDNLGVTTIGNNKIITSKILNSNITYNKIQDVTTGKILGRISSGNGIVEEIATTGTGDVVRAISPTFTGTPLVPTAIVSSNDGTIANTEFVKRAISNIDANAVDGIISGEKGGTGVANTGKTITLGGNFATSGANSLMFTTTGATNVTLPTSGTLATYAQLQAIQGGTFSGGQITGIVAPTNGGTGIDNGIKTITLGGSLLTGAAFTTTGTTGAGNAAAITLKTTAATDLTLPTTGTVATLNGSETLTNKTITATANTISGLTNANLSGSAAITDANLATISTAGKIANTATTATNVNTFNTIVSRDGSGNFNAGTITASLAGNAATSTKLATARSIYGNSFDGSADLGQVIASSYGGTGNAYTKFTGATSSEKIYNLPDANTTILTTNALITPAQGGTGVATAAMNTFFAGPASGSDAAPSFRALSASDLPAGNGSYIANSTTQQANSNFNISGAGVIAGNLTAGSIIRKDGTSAQFLKADGTVDSRSFATLTGSESLTNKSINGVTPTAVTTGFTIAGGLTNNRTLTVSADANVSATNTGDVALSGQNYLSISNQTITAAAVNLAGTNVTGTLAAARFPALTGDITNTAGTVATTISNDAITSTKIADNAVTSTKIADNAVTSSKIVTGAVALDKIAPISVQTLLGNKSNSAASAPGEITIGNGLALNPSTGVLSASGSGGTVSSVSALTLGTSGTDLNSTVANGSSTPVITLNVPTASATNRGVLSSTDWTTFNSKQSSIPLKFKSGTSGGGVNIGISPTDGHDALGRAANSGYNNIAIGSNAMGSYYMAHLTGWHNVAIGTDAGGRNASGSGNIFLGSSTGMNNYDGSNNTFVGYLADVNLDNPSPLYNNATAIGYEARVTGSNKIQLGNANILNVSTSGTITVGAVTYPKVDGTNGQVLVTNGSGVATFKTIDGAGANLTDGKILVGNTSNVATAVSVSGDITMTNAGVTSIAAGAVVTADLANAAVSYAKIQNMSAKTLIGNKSLTAGVPGEITLGTGLALDASTGVLSASGSGGTVSGTGTAGQLPYWSSTTALGGNPNFTWDNTNKIAKIGEGVNHANVESSNLSLTTMPVFSVIGKINDATEQTLLRLKRVENHGSSYEGVFDFVSTGASTGNLARLDIRLNSPDNANNKNVLSLENLNGNVGINNTTPTEKLDVIGNLRFSGALKPNNLAGTAGQVLTSQGGSSAPTWVTPSSGIGGSGTASYIPKFNASTTTLGNSKLFDDGTSVFVNSIDGSGGNKFVVNSGARTLPAISGTTQSGGAIRIGGSSNDVMDIGIGSLNGWIQVADKLALSTKYALLLNPNGGNVGIGVTSATSTLHVNGNVKANSFNDLIVKSNGSNVVLGQGNVLASLTTGENNIAVGQYTLNYLDAGSANLGMGYSAMYNTRGSSNVGLGHEALWTNNAGNNNTAVGHTAGRANSGSNNTFVGYQSNSSGSITNATAIGNGAIVNADNTIQLGNTSVTSVKTSGAFTAGAITYPNVAGTNGYVLTTNGSNTASWVAAATGIGGSGTASYIPKFNASTTILGDSKLFDDGTSVMINSSSTALAGGAALLVSDGVNAAPVTTGTTQTGGALRIRGGDNTVIDFGTVSTKPWIQAGDAVGLGTNYPLYINPNGGNVAIGLGTASTTSSKLQVNGDVGATSFNSLALKRFSSSIAIGSGAPSVSGNDNIAIGQETLNTLTSAGQNIAIGYQAMFKTNTEENTAIGHLSMRENTGRYNTAIGFRSGYDNNTNDYNTFLGHSTNSSGSITNATAIGNGAIVTASNTMQLGNANVTSVKTSGAFNAPVYSSSPVALTAGTTITWAPMLGLNASVTLNANSTLSFGATAPPAGSSGTLIVTQPASGSTYTLALPSGGTHKVLGSASGITLSTTNSAKDIVSFYFDGSIYYWNVGIGYGAAQSLSANTLTGGVAGAIPYQTATNITGFTDAGTAGQLLTSQGVGKPTWTTPTAMSGSGNISRVIVPTYTSTLTLNDTYSGSLVYTQHNNSPSFPESLADGFYCTIVNYGGAVCTSNTLTTAKFYTNNTGNTGSSTFSIPLGGTVSVYAIKIGGAQRYYINYGDAPAIAGTGLANNAGTFNVNASQNISTLSNLTTNGIVTTTGGTGALTVVASLPVTQGGTGQTSYTTGDILYSSASNTLSKLAAGTNGHVLTLASGVPTWAAASGGISGSGTQNYLPKYNNAAGTTLGNSVIKDDGTTVTLESNRTFTGANAAVNAQTGTTYSLVQGDNGRVITMNNASAITLTIPTSLTAGFNCMIVQYGAGTVTIVGASGVTVVNRSNYNKTGGQYAIVTIVSPVANTFITGGDMQ